MELNGVWRSNDGGVYFFRQVDDTLWWVGEKENGEWLNVFKGAVKEETIEGKWISLPKGETSGSGELNLNIQGNKIVIDSSSGNFPSREWKKENLLSFLANFFANQGEFLKAGYNVESNLTGGWIGNDSGFYYIRESDNTVWWYAEHPKLQWAHVFLGTKKGNKITGEWVDLPKGKTTNKGRLDLTIDFPGRSLRRTSEDDTFPGTYWSKIVGDFNPGEAGYDPDYHPECWSIKWDNHSGLNYDAYNSIARSPYIQNVTSDSATIIWRVGIPRGINPAEIIPTFKAEAFVAPLDTPVANGKKYTPQNGITISDCSWSYQYRPGVNYGNNTKSSVKNDAFRLKTSTSRPIIQCKVRFKDLQPGIVYHYRIKSDTTDPTSGLNEESLRYYTLANDVFFRTAPAPDQNLAVKFLAMGDLGPGNSQPDYFYDVFDLFHDIARKYSADFWLALGDIDNNTNGHPNAMDPFFFNVYNAFHDHNFGEPPRRTSVLNYIAKETTTKAFQKPPYFGLLGGLPVFPTFGNRDFGPKKASLENWRKSYLSNFELPSDGLFNQAGQGFFYTFRYANVIFISLCLPGSISKLGVAENDWRAEWGDRQRSYLENYLHSLKNETDARDVWVVAFFHDHNWGYTLKTKEQQDFSKFLAESGVDIVLNGHQHFFAHKTVKHGEFDYRAIVAGTGGFGENSWHANNVCKRPGFIMANVYKDTFEYWKMDTHKCSTQGIPEKRDQFSPIIREYCSIKKLGLGKHEIKEYDLNVPYEIK